MPAMFDVIPPSETFNLTSLFSDALTAKKNHPNTTLLIRMGAFAFRRFSKILSNLETIGPNTLPKTTSYYFLGIQVIPAENLTPNEIEIIPDSFTGILHTPHNSH